MRRRQFLKTSVMAGASALLLRGRAWPYDQSPTGVTKFVVPLPGLGPTGIPVLTPNTTRFPGKDFYEVQVAQYTQQVHPAIPPTTFWGYADATTKNHRYLGGVIVAKRNRPVRLRVTNLLPASHMLPVDPTQLDPGENARTDKIAVHLHGGLVQWRYDGGPYNWFSNANNPGGFVHGPSFINGDGDGAAIYDYPNNQSARLQWYHDHAHGITRQNAYAGIASAYLITDEAETLLVQGGVLPNFPGYPLGVPLIIQDKTFWDGGGNDPDYNLVVPAANVGSLWYPHVYEPNGPAPSGRWDLGLATDSLPPVSAVPEFFADTILVNGAPYPTFGPLPPRRMRFRFLNGSQARFYNLQLYVADGSPDGITLAPLATGEVDPNGNPIQAPTNAAGPAFIQIGTEGGFLPHPAVFSADGSNVNSNLVMGWKTTVDPLDPTNFTANRYNLLVAPAERPDVIIDFRGFEGQRLILYNDAPAPFPGGDVRNDYYPGSPDQSAIGGAPTPVPGNGPDTRILMRFEVGTSGAIRELSFEQTVNALKVALPVTFLVTQPPTNITPSGPALVKTLNEDFDKYGRLRQVLGTNVGGVEYLASPTEVAHRGEVQRWQIFNLTGDTHPMRFHLVNVVIRKREYWAFDSLGSPLLNGQGLPYAIPGSEHPVDENDKGWKETVRINPGEIVTVDMKFDMPSGAPPSPRLQASYGITGAEYVWHCHILEHEEHDMMRPLVVLG